jgi:phosphate starvation-inducible PhoH-like protein
VTLSPLDNRALANLTGPLDANLRQIEAALDVAISHRGGSFTIAGDPTQAARAGEALQRFYAAAEEAAVGRRHPARAGRDHLAERRRARRAGRRRARAAHAARRTCTAARRTRSRTSRTSSATTSRSASARGHRQDVSRRRVRGRRARARSRQAHRARAPAVEAGERLGFLPGDLAQKVDPYLRPLYDALYDLMGFDKVREALRAHTIEVAPLAYMRGRTLNTPSSSSTRRRTRRPSR